MGISLAGNSERKKLLSNRGSGGANGDLVVASTLAHCPLPSPFSPLASRLRPKPCDALVLSNDFAWSPVDAGRPVVGGHDRFQPVEDPQRLGPVVDQLPAAFQLRVDLAFSFPRSAARAVEQALGATADRADAGKFSEATIAAADALPVGRSRPRHVRGGFRARPDG